MEELYTLAQKLTSGERSIVRIYLRCFSTHPCEEETLTERLFDYLLRTSTEPSEKDCRIVAYSTHRGKKDAFEKLKYRLLAIILEAINSEINVEMKKLDEVDYAAVRIKKKTSQLRQLFYSKPGLPVTRNLLEK